MHRAEEVNATGTELLDRIGRVQIPDRKGAVGKDRRNRISFRLETSNEPQIEWKMKWKP